MEKRSGEGEKWERPRIRKNVPGFMLSKAL